jgi:hypothetical protein
LFFLLRVGFAALLLSFCTKIAWCDNGATLLDIDKNWTACVVNKECAAVGRSAVFPKDSGKGWLQCPAVSTAATSKGCVFWGAINKKYLPELKGYKTGASIDDPSAVCVNKKCELSNFTMHIK